MKTQLEALSYETPTGNFIVRKDGLAHAQQVFGNSKIGWKQCHSTLDGVNFFLDLCELFKLEFIPEDIPVKSYESKNIYFSLCDAIALAELPKDAMVDGIEPIKPIEPLELDIYNIVNGKDTVVEPIQEVVVTNVIVTKDEEAAITAEITPEIIDEVTEESVDEITEEVSEGTTAEVIQNNIEEDFTMKNVNIAAIIEETAQEMTEGTVVNNEQEDNTMDAQERIEEATNEAGTKVKEAMGIVNKYVSEFRIEADKIANMKDKEVYDYVMGRIDCHIENFSKWTGDKFAVVADALKAQKAKMKKAVNKAEDAVDEEDLDEDTKVGILDGIKSFIGKVIKAAVVILKAAAKLIFKLGGIVLTFGFRVGKTIIFEGINAGIGVKDAVLDTMEEIQKGLATPDDTVEFEDDFEDFEEDLENADDEFSGLHEGTEENSFREEDEDDSKKGNK